MITSFRNAHIVEGLLIATPQKESKLVLLKEPNAAKRAFLSQPFEEHSIVDVQTHRFG